jgi:hypothetical protein
VLERPNGNQDQHAPQYGSMGLPCPEAILISDLLESLTDRSLGYRGHDRLVLFYYEPRGQEIMWRDQRSYGFGVGGWRAYQQQLAPLARSYGVSIGDDRAHGCYVLLLDRQLGLAYFVPRRSAESLVRDQGD